MQWWLGYYPPTCVVMTLTWTHRRCPVASCHAAACVRLLLKYVHWCELPRQRLGGGGHREGEDLMSVDTKSFAPSSMPLQVLTKEAARDDLPVSLQAGEAGEICSVVFFFFFSLFLLISTRYHPAVRDCFFTAEPGTAALNRHAGNAAWRTTWWTRKQRGKRLLHNLIQRREF